MNRLSIDAYKDGRDLVLIIRNCDPSLENMIVKNWQPRMLSDSNLEPPEEDERLCVGRGRYMNMTPAEVLEKEGMTGFGNLAYLLNKGSFNDETAIKIRSYMNDYLKNFFDSIGDPEEYADNITDEELEQFYKYVMLYADPRLKNKVAEANAYVTYEEWDKEASPETKKTNLISIIKAWKKIICK